MAVSNESTPLLYNEDKRHAKTVTLDAVAKGTQPFETNLLREGEVIEFPTEDQLRSKESKCLKEADLYAGSTRKTYLVKVNSNYNGITKDIWFNVGDFFRTLRDAEGERFPIDEVRTEIASQGDGGAALLYVAGRKIKGEPKIDGYKAEYKDGKFTGNYIHAQFVPMAWEE